MSDGEDRAHVRIHFASGKTVDTVLECDDGVFVDIEDVVEGLVKGEPGSTQYGKPHWTWIGDVFLYTQGLEGVEVL